MTQGEHKSMLEAEDAVTYLCHFCNKPFARARGAGPPIRFVGREPKVECPACGNDRAEPRPRRSSQPG